MRYLILITALFFTLSLNVFAGLKHDIVALSKTVASTATPEAMIATKTLTSKVVIEAKSTNTQPVTIGDSVKNRAVINIRYLMFYFLFLFI